MMEITESQYKYNLAIDLIYYLMTNLIQNHPNKIEMVQHVMQKWDARITQNLRKVNVEESKSYAEKHDVEIDVASIILSAHQEEVQVLRKEFLDQTTQILINTMLQNIKSK